MLETKMDSTALKRSLKYKFLFNGDLESMQLLLNIYELEENIEYITPRYLPLSELRKSIEKILKDRRGVQLTARNLAELIHDNINRFELSIYLEGYINGYRSIKLVNKLEKMTLKHMDLPTLYKRNYLYQYSAMEDEVKSFRAIVMRKLNYSLNQSESFFSNIRIFYNSMIMPKVMKLNDHLDSQLTMESDGNETIIKYECEPFTPVELAMLSRALSTTVTSNAAKLYKEAFWNGLNDRVLKRYR
ncbi:MAG: hypothetical protein Q4P29_06640 [Tissierellia bacterium]|nr:hypothetical protein [Tissierellia bacterium]